MKITKEIQLYNHVSSKRRDKAGTRCSKTQHFKLKKLVWSQSNVQNITMGSNVQQDVDTEFWLEDQWWNDGHKPLDSVTSVEWRKNCVSHCFCPRSRRHNILMLRWKLGNYGIPYFLTDKSSSYAFHNSIYWQHDCRLKLYKSDHADSWKFWVSE